MGHTGRFVWLYSYELGALIFDVFFFSMNRYYAGDDSELAISLFFLFFFFRLIIRHSYLTCNNHVSNFVKCICTINFLQDILTISAS